ncbi:hypothetical protein ACFLWX_03280 [Chloroflexota bacterium]
MSSIFGENKSKPRIQPKDVRTETKKKMLEFNKETFAFDKLKEVTESNQEFLGDYIAKQFGMEQ